MKRVPSHEEQVMLGLLGWPNRSGLLWQILEASSAPAPPLRRQGRLQQQGQVPRVASSSDQALQPAARQACAPGRAPLPVALRRPGLSVRRSLPRHCDPAQQQRQPQLMPLLHRQAQRRLLLLPTCWSPEPMGAATPRPEEEAQPPTPPEAGRTAPQAPLPRCRTASCPPGRATTAHAHRARQTAESPKPRRPDRRPTPQGERSPRPPWPAAPA